MFFGDEFIYELQIQYSFDLIVVLPLPSLNVFLQAAYTSIGYLIA